MKIRKKYMAAGTAFLSAVFLFAAVPVPAEARAVGRAARQSEEPVSVQVEYGLKNIVSPDSRFPVTVRLDSRGTEFSGVLKCSYVIREYTGGAAETALGSLLTSWTADAGSREIVREIPVEIQGKEPWEVTFFASVDYNEAEYTFTLEDAFGNTVSEQEVKIFPQNSGSDYIVGVVAQDSELAGLIKSYQWPYGQISESLSMTVVELEPEELTVENLNQDVPDAVILSGKAEEQLSVSQQTALAAWASRGGLLVEGAEAQNVLELFGDAVAGADINHLIQRAYGGSSYGDYSSYVIGNMPVESRPDIAVYIVLLTVYAVLAGPGLYLILKRLRKRYYLWTGMLAMALAAVAFIWLYSSQTRVKAPFISYLETIRQGEAATQECVEFGIQAPFNSSFDLYTDGSYELIPWQLQSGGWSDQELNPDFLGKIRIQRQEDKRRISVSGFPSFTMTGYSLLRNTPNTFGEGLESSLQIADGTVEGTIVNHTGYRIVNTVLLMPETAVWIGELEAGETLSVSGLLAEPLNEAGRREFYRTHAHFSDEALSEFETEVWESAAGRFALYNGADSILIGTAEGRAADWQLDSGYEAHGYSYYIAPANVELEQDETFFCPFAQQYRSDDTMPYIEGMALTGQYLSGDEYTATYHLNDLLGGSPALRLEAEKISFVESAYVEEYTEKFSGRIDLYNYAAGRFESLDGGRRTLDGELLKAYLNEKNELTVRYVQTERQPESEGSCLLPSMWVSGKVVRDAED